MGTFGKRRFSNGESGSNGPPWSMVVWMSAWPSCCWTRLIDSPAPSHSVAAVWRRWCRRIAAGLELGRVDLLRTSEPARR